MYLESFALPIDREDDLLREKAAYNGGMNGYIDNPYPCGLFVQKQLYEIEFGRITNILRRQRLRKKYASQSDCAKAGAQSYFAL